VAALKIQKQAVAYLQKYGTSKQLVLCKYSKFQIESNSYFSIRFETSTIIPNFRIVAITNFLLI